MHTKFWSEGLKGRYHSEEIGVEGKIMLEWSVGRCGLDASGSRQVPVVGYCEHGNEHSGSIKGGEFLDQLSDY